MNSTMKYSDAIHFHSYMQSKSSSNFLVYVVLSRAAWETYGVRYPESLEHRIYRRMPSL